MKQGMTLVGLLVAVGILSVSLATVIGLQARLVRFQGEIEYSATANLLATEPLELARAVYAENRNQYNANPTPSILINAVNGWDTGLQPGTYAIDYNTFDVGVGFQQSVSSIVSSCTESSLNSGCRLYLDDTLGFVKSSSNPVVTPEIYRFVTINNRPLASDFAEVVSTVVIIDQGKKQVYKGYTTIYNVDLP